MALRRARNPHRPDAGHRGAMPIGDGKKALEELFRIGPAANGEEIDELDEQARAAAARAAHRFSQAVEARQEAVMADRSSGPLGTSRMPVASTTIAPGPPWAKRSYHAMTSSVTIALLGRPPWHHGRNPGALGSDTGPISTAEKNRDAAASDAEGMRPAEAVNRFVALVSTRSSLRVSWAATALMSYSVCRRFRRAGRRLRLPISPEAYS